METMKRTPELDRQSFDYIILRLRCLPYAQCKELGLYLMSDTYIVNDLIEELRGEQKKHKLI